MPLTTTVIKIDNHITARVGSFCENPKLANTQVTIVRESFGEEGVFYPAQDVCIYGPAIKALRDLLNSLPTD